MRYYADVIESGRHPNIRVCMGMKQQCTDILPGTDIHPAMWVCRLYIIALTLIDKSTDVSSVLSQASCMYYTKDNGHSY